MCCHSSLVCKLINTIIVIDYAHMEDKNTYESSSDSALDSELTDVRLDLEEAK